MPTAWTCLTRLGQLLNLTQQSQHRGASDKEHEPKQAATAPCAPAHMHAVLSLPCPCLQVSSEDGIVACFDARKGANSDALYRLSAHDHATCALSFSSAAPGLLATCSTDKQVRSAAIACMNSGCARPLACCCWHTLSSMDTAWRPFPVVQVKLWDVSTGQPSLITAQDLKVSNMYCSHS